MGIAASGFAFFEGAFSYALPLALEWALEIECSFEVLPEVVAELLFGADGVKFCFVVLFAVYVACAYAHFIAFFAVEFVKVFSEVCASCFLHLVGEVGDACLDGSALGFFAGIKAIAFEASALCQMVHGSPQGVSVCLFFQIECFGEAYMAAMVGVYVFGVAGALP